MLSYSELSEGFWGNTTRNEAYTDDFFDTYADDMLSVKTYTDDLSTVQVVGISPLVKVKNIIGIDVVGTDPPI